MKVGVDKSQDSWATTCATSQPQMWAAGLSWGAKIGNVRERDLVDLHRHRPLLRSAGTARQGSVSEARAPRTASASASAYSRAASLTQRSVKARARLTPVNTRGSVVMSAASSGRGLVERREHRVDDHPDREMRASCTSAAQPGGHG
ncbi:MAG: hypothetical protein H6740_07905 [Alphaproteobacteria bacterium]|nr:hypothetical protein [Alphaproteobacteria bacterium]